MITRAFFLTLFLFGGILGSAFAETDIGMPRRIVYSIKPLGGRSEYTNLGEVELNGQKVNKSVFYTHIFGFADTETIYIRKKDLLPVRVDRDIWRLIGHEYITEIYDQENFTVTIIKHNGKNEISREVHKAGGPIHNAVIMMLYAGLTFDFNLGWRKVFWVPNKFEVFLSSLEKIKIRKKNYQAYHFKSRPDKFEVWVNKDQPHIPLLIKGKGGFNYRLILKEYSRDGKMIK